MKPIATTSNGFIEQVYRSHQEPLQSYLAEIVGSPEIAQELVQECFEYVHRTYRASQVMFPRALLFRTATDLGLTYLRLRRSEGRYSRQVLHMRYLKAVVPDSYSQPPDRQAMAEQIKDRVAAAVKGLRPAHRRVFVMALLLGKSRKEIAAAVGASEKRVDKRMTKAIKACRARLATDGVDLADFLSFTALLQFACLLGVR